MLRHASPRLMTYLLTISTLAWSLNSHAQLAFDSVSSKDIKNASCFKTVTPEEMQSYVDKAVGADLDSGNLADLTVGSTSIKGMSKTLVDAFEHAMLDKSYLQTVASLDSQIAQLSKNPELKFTELQDKKNQLLTSLKKIETELEKKISMCPDIQCAFEAAAQDHLSIIYSFIRFNAVIPFKSDGKKVPSKLVSSILATLIQLPEGWFPLSKMAYFGMILKMPARLSFLNTSSTMAEYKTSSNLILAHNGVMGESSTTQINTLTHEVGHLIGNTHKINGKKLDRSPEWHALRNENYISKYAMTNEVEDFAESFDSYRYSPKHLKRTSPKKYQFMKDVFLGLEYLEESDCQNL